MNRRPKSGQNMSCDNRSRRYGARDLAVGLRGSRSCICVLFESGDAGYPTALFGY